MAMLISLPVRSYASYETVRLTPRQQTQCQNLKREVWHIRPVGLLQNIDVH